MNYIYKKYSYPPEQLPVRPVKLQSAPAEGQLADDMVTDPIKFGPSHEMLEQLFV